MKPAPVLTTNTVNAIETLTEEDFTGEQRDGYLNFRLTDLPGDAAELLLQAMVLGLDSIQESYGDSYIQIDTKERCKTMLKNEPSVICT